MNCKIVYDIRAVYLFIEIGKLTCLKILLLFISFQDRESMERTIVSLQRKMEEINVSCVNLKNELLTAKTDLAAYERKLQKECRNNEMLESEKQYLLEKVSILLHKLPYGHLHLPSSKK